MTNFKINHTGKIKMYENGNAYDMNGGFLGRCSVPDFDSEEDLQNAGFSIEDIEEDDMGRYLEVEGSEFGF